MISNNENNLYFCNYDCYDNNKEWLSRFIKIFTDENIETKEFKNFDMCMNYLISKNFFISVNKGDNLIYLLNNLFDLNIENKNNLSFDKIEDYICENLKDSKKGLVYIYSAGSYYCYGITSSNTINELKVLFKPLFDDYMK